MQRKGKNLLQVLLWIAALVLAVAIFSSLVVLYLEVTTNGTDSNYDLTKIGAWGDTIGGLLNPVLSFLALIALLWTITIQSEELSLTRKELENSTVELKGSREANEALVAAAQRRSIEDSFFQLFNYFSRSVDNMSFSGALRSASVETYNGARGFEAIAYDFRYGVSRYCSRLPANFGYDTDPDSWPPDGINEAVARHGSKEGLIEYLGTVHYESIYVHNQAELGKYFRILYNVLRFLSERRGQLPSDVIETYMKMFRAGLSNFELLLIVLNCLSDAGRPMIKYVNEFELLDNLPPELLMVSYTDAHGNEVGTLDMRQLAGCFAQTAFGQNANLFWSNK